MLLGAFAVALMTTTAKAHFAPGQDAASPLTIVVMDPLADKLACSCVQGYAQRKYDWLGQYLERSMGDRVRIVYSEDLQRALLQTKAGSVDLIIGKHSLVRFDLGQANIPATPLCMLTGKDGRTDLTGLFVVKKSDPARSLADLKGRKVLFGRPESAEKHAAAVVALEAAGVSVPKTLAMRSSCSDAAIEIVDSKSKPAPAAVISSYALALIEGCGSVPKGALRVISKTKPVPFVAVFATGRVGPNKAHAILEALLAVKDDPVLLGAMESKYGFVPVAQPLPEQRASTTPVPSTAEWPGWRGAGRDGQAAWLPETLPAQPRILWKQPLAAPGHGGIAVGGGFAIVGDRDPTDRNDVFRCFKSETGAPVWKLVYPAIGKLDYGNGPRATPQIVGDRVYLLGAFGDLHCIDLATGKAVWRTNLAARFGAQAPTWGYSSSPLVIGSLLIVNPGAPDASLVALDRDSGSVVWKTPGAPAAYAAFIVGRFGGVEQIVGYDAKSLGGWDPKSGDRLWTLVPEIVGDFNVPTPIEYQGRLIVATERNGARLYGFSDDGKLDPRPQGVFRDLSPDTATPVLADGRLYGCRAGLYCLDPANGLSQLWAAQGALFDSHTSWVACGDRLLMTTYDGMAVLMRASASRLEMIACMRVFSEDVGVFSHPAVSGRCLYVRDDSSIRCISLTDEPAHRAPFRE